VLQRFKEVQFKLW